MDRLRGFLEKRFHRYHYYSFTFQYVDPSKTVTASVYIGYPRKYVSNPQIMDAKIAALKGVDTETPEEAVLLSCCYLGKMTPTEMNGSDIHQEEK